MGHSISLKERYSFTEQQSHIESDFTTLVNPRDLADSLR
jgi:hypothetical protein